MERAGVKVRSARAVYSLQNEGRALERLAERLHEYEASGSLTPASERRLLSAERRLASARSAFLLAMATQDE